MIQPMISLALLHHPVLNKTGETIGSAVTNLDLHDISRAARTYGVNRYYVATPYEDQHELIGEIIDHWQTGHGARANPARKEALSIVQPVKDLETIVAELTEGHNEKVFVVATSARHHDNEISYGALQSKIEQKIPVLLLFGTAHGLAPEIMKQADGILPPIQADSDYNHLSVRSAVSIILDRLLGNK